MAGRKPQPTHLRLVKGNPSKRAVNRTEPKPAGALFSAPAWFDEEHTAAWNYAIAHAPIGLLKRLDRDVLRVWVCASVIHKAAIEQLKADAGKSGELPIVKRSRKGGLYPSPFLSVANRQAEIMIRAAGELGFSPAARTKISINYGEGEEGEKDVTAKFGL